MKPFLCLKEQGIFGGNVKLKQKIVSPWGTVLISTSKNNKEEISIKIEINSILSLF